VVAIGRHSGPQSLTIRKLLALGEAGRELLEKTVRNSKHRLLLKDLTLCAPIHDPTKYLGLGYSFAAMSKKCGRPKPKTVFPKHQVWFNKQVSCIFGPYDAIHRPRVSQQLDYEGESAVVIGTTCRRVERQRAET
jgi:2-keto-4-pentenoate hydratase/2-oxohepta-3-ene-1,7-dioic acid hydratase in catechol pathway